MYECQEDVEQKDSLPRKAEFSSYPLNFYRSSNIMEHYGYRQYGILHKNNYSQVIFQALFLKNEMPV